MKGPNEILPVVVAVRLTEDDMNKLDQLASESKRTRSNMLRVLIDQEYERKLSQSTQPAPAAS